MNHICNKVSKGMGILLRSRFSDHSVWTNIDFTLKCSYKTPFHLLHYNLGKYIQEILSASHTEKGNQNIFYIL